MLDLPPDRRHAETNGRGGSLDHAGPGTLLDVDPAPRLLLQPTDGLAALADDHADLLGVDLDGGDARRPCADHPLRDHRDRRGARSRDRPGGRGPGRDRPRQRRRRRGDPGAAGQQRGRQDDQHWKISLAI